jgi:arsenite-transporting ATPase
VPTRTILYTGKGGVGKTSVAAATARRCAAGGCRTLIVSTDPAHSLSESLGCSLSGEPGHVSGRLWGLEVDAQAEMANHWGGVQEWLGGLLIERGIDRISAEELTVPPGLDELFSLLRLQDQHRRGEWEVIVVDCAPTGETLRMLSFPEVARWWLGKALGPEHQLLAAAAPIARSMLDIPLPGGPVFSDLQRLSENLIGMNEILRDRRASSVRLVLTPDRMVIGEAMRTFTYLNLYGYLTDAVVVNKVFPDEVGAYFEGWRARQEQHLELVRSAFSPVPVLTAPYFESEVVGGEMLDRLAGELFDGESGLDAAAVLHEGITQTLSSDGEGAATLRLALPFARKEEITLKQVGQELVVSVPGQRRTIMLPDSLAGHRPSGARFEDGALEVSFARR